MNRYILAMLLATPAATLADEGPFRGGTEKFKLNFGTILNRNDTSLRLEDRGGPRHRVSPGGLHRPWSGPLEHARLGQLALRA